MKTETAVYIGADPFTFNDMELVKRVIRSFGYATILLDRKNRDAKYERYMLNYADRADIIRHDLNKAGLKEYRICPIDETVQKAVTELGITTVVLNLDYQKTTGFNMMNVMQRICPKLNIMCMSAWNFIERKFMRTLLDSDSSMTLYKEYCSDYAFYKFKLKNTRKLAVTGNFGCGQDILCEAFAENGNTVVDLDKNIIDIVNEPSVISKFKQEFIQNYVPVSGVFTKDGIDKSKMLGVCNENQKLRSALEDIVFETLQTRLGKTIVQSFNDTLIVNSSFLFEFELNTLFDDIICAYAPEITQRDRLVASGKSDDYVTELLKFQTQIREKAEKSDYVFYGDRSESEMRRNALELVRNFSSKN